MSPTTALRPSSSPLKGTWDRSGQLSFYVYINIHNINYLHFRLTLIMILIDINNVKNNFYYILLFTYHFNILYYYYDYCIHFTLFLFFLSRLWITCSQQILDLVTSTVKMCSRYFLSFLSNAWKSFQYKNVLKYSVSCAGVWRATSSAG